MDRGCVDTGGVGRVCLDRVYVDRGVCTGVCGQMAGVNRGHGQGCEHPLQHTTREGRRGGGTHPTGMHTCCYIFLFET